MRKGGLYSPNLNYSVPEYSKFLSVCRYLPASTVGMVGAFGAPEGWLLINHTFSILAHTASILIFKTYY